MTRSGKAWYVVGLLCLLGIMSYMDRLALSLVIDPLRQELSIDDTDAGLLMGPAFALFYAAMAFPLAWVVDHGNRKRILAAGVLLWSLATSASAFAPDFTTLLMFRMGVGVGEAVLSPAAVSLIGDLFVRERRPTPMSAVLASQVIGTGASFVIVAAILAAASSGTLPLPAFLTGLSPWRITLFAVGLPGILLAAILMITVREPRRVAIAEGSDETDGAFPTTGRAIRFFIPFLIGGNLVATGVFIVAMWYPTHLIRHFGLSASTVGLNYGLISIIGGSLGTIGFAALMERLVRAGRKDALLHYAILALPVVLILFLIACLAPSFTFALAAMILFQFLGNGTAAIPSVVIASLAASRLRGRMAAVHLLCQAIIPSSLAPLAVGYLSDRQFDGKIGLALCAVGLVSYPLGLLLLLSCRRAYVDAVHGRG